MAIVVNLDDKRGGSPKPSLDALQSLVADDLSKVNALILKEMDSPVALIPQLAGHIIAAGGKRLRPMLLLGAAKLCGYKGDRHVGLAGAVEFIHTATLLHDDVVDDSDLRRGRSTANAVWGNQPSVLVGDFLFSRSFQLMVRDGSLDVLAILSNASAVIAEGEVMQLTTANDTSTSEAAYLEVITAKTATLFAAATRLGAVVAGRPKVEEEALEAFGLNLGIAFQLTDDVLDYAADSETMGKDAGDDFREGKVTLPVVLAYRRGDADEQAFWRRTLEELDQNDGDLARAIGLLEGHGALNDTLDRARHYTNLARDSLDIFPAGETKDALLDVVAFCAARTY
ncbi:MAG TPA: polyprenyl synthetase family protein [Alphaproteobacteria bacterium]|nr:polyprenyl synthetase family protein [Alphaproteobacteria bacterium]